MIRRFSISAVFILSILSLNAQQIDTVDLLKNLNKTRNKNEKLKLYIELSETYRDYNNIEKSVFYSQKGLKLSEKVKSKDYTKKFLNLTAENSYFLSDFKESFSYYSQLLHLAEETGDLKYKGYALRGYLKNYWHQGLYQNAVLSGTEAVKIFEQTNDKVNLNITKMNIVSVYIDLKKFKQAEKICDKLLSDKNNLNDTLFIADIYEKKGAVKFYKKYFPLARNFYNKAYKLFQSKNKKISAAVELGNIGETFEMEGKYSKAIEFYEKALITEKNLKFYSGMIFLYKVLGRTYSKTKNYKKAKQYYFKALSYINKIGENRELANVYELLHQLYAQNKDYKKAYEYALKTMQVNETLKGENVQNKINIIRIKYETEQAQKENQILKLKEKSQKKTNNKQFWIIIIISVLLLLIFIILVMLYRINSKNKKTKILLAEKNRKLDSAYTNIKESIDYAGKVQNAMLSSYTETLKILPEFIILYKPAYTLSGDFYWSKKINDTVFVAVGDSTGHGISGALLSITGMSFLNEIVAEDYIQTDVILNNLRSKIKHRLNQKGDFYEQKDGWDISIFSLNLKTLQGQFSGAFNSLYTISEKNNKKTITKYKADRQPAGIYYHEKPFKHQNFNIKKGDIIWMFTDGFPDQYNDAGNKKYSSKRFKELLVSISEKELSEQKNILNSEFIKWKGNFEQVDDVLILGIKI